MPKTIKNNYRSITILFLIYTLYEMLMITILI
nr:MAG TPA: hypothetical protein [Caudoviricetes sp.]